MNKLNITNTETICRIELANGKANIIDSEMIDELSLAFDNAESNNSINALILIGKGGFFSAGLDIFQLIEMDKIEIESYFTRFINLLIKMITFKKISIAAISGHSPAGGCVLSLTCDYRIMQKGNYKIGLNEIPVGMMIPKLIWKMMAFAIGSQSAYQMILSGSLVTPDYALNLGLVHELSDQNELDNQVMSKIKKLSELNQDAWQKSKELMLNNFYQFSNTDFTDLTEFSEHWWSESFQNQLKTMAKQLKK